MESIELLPFLQELDKRKINYKLGKVKYSITAEVAVPGQRWEIEFFDDEHIEIKKYISDGTVFNESEISALFNEFSD